MPDDELLLRQKKGSNIDALSFYQNGEYDKAVGHLRRYDKKMLADVFSELECRIVTQKYWGFTLVPFLIGRNLLINSKTPQEEVIERGLKSGSDIIENLFNVLMKIETGCVNNAFLGASLLAEIEVG